MRFKLYFSTALFFITLIGFSQNDNGKTTNISLIKVNKVIYMLQDKGGNIGLSVGDDGIFMIDDQFAESIPDIMEKIKTISKKPVKFLVNTHFHGDHTGGNVAMATSGTTIFSQENVRDRLEKLMRTSTEKIDPAILPVITFKEDLNFFFNGEKIYVFHVHNAHTDGDVMVYFTGSNVLHAGDVFFNGKYPYIDTENGGSLKGYIEGLEKILLVANEDTKIIPGHGKVGTTKDITETINMLTFLYKRVTYNHGLLKTLPEILAMTDLTEQYESKGYGDGFIKRERFLTTIYNEVVKERGN